MVEPGDALMIDGGSTTRALRADAGGTGAAPHRRHELPARGPGARRESALPHDPVPRATTSRAEDGVYGAEAVDFIRRFKANKAFIGAGGVTPEGVTDADSLGCAIKRAMMERSDRTILLVDSSKFDVVQFERVCALTDIDAMVSEAAPPKRLRGGLKSAGVHVVVAAE